MTVGIPSYPYIFGMCKTIFIYVFVSNLLYFYLTFIFCVMPFSFWQPLQNCGFMVLQRFISFVTHIHYTLMKNSVPVFNLISPYDTLLAILMYMKSVKMLKAPKRIYWHNSAHKCWSINVKFIFLSPAINGWLSWARTMTNQTTLSEKFINRHCMFEPW